MTPTPSALNRGLFLSTKTDWGTPPAFFQRLNSEFHFTRDVCATAENRLCRRFWTTRQDALTRRWKGRCWMNPPYGRMIGRWIRKAHAESRRGTTVVTLLPARTDTRWWHEHVMKASEVRLLLGRLTFVGAPAPAPFPSAIVVFDARPRSHGTPRFVAWNWRTDRLPEWGNREGDARPRQTSRRRAALRRDAHTRRTSRTAHRGGRRGPLQGEPQLGL